MAAMARTPEPPAALAGLALAAAIIALPTAGASQNARRVLLVLARTPDAPQVAAQRRELRRLAADGDDRDLDMVVAAAGRKGLLGRRGDFEAVLIGKDGGVKARSARVLSADALRATIDAMPMARAQAARRRQGAPRP